MLLRFKLNANETREAIREIQEIAFRDKKSINETIDEILLKVGQSQVRVDSFRRELKLMRYPFLSQVEEEFRDCLNDLSLPKEISIHHPPFFEGSYIEIRIKVESTERLSQILSHLISAVERGLIDRLMSIVRDGGAQGVML
ncbi:MAG: hypothetical protein C4291_08830 [Candidatus Dadabacteria bacterium]